MKRGDLPDDPELKKTLLYYRTLSAQKRKAYSAALRKEVPKVFAPLLREFNQPEHRWHFNGFGAPKHSDPVMRSIMVATGAEIYGEYLKSFALSRTQLRLLRLHAHMQGYKLKTGHYPAFLSDLKAGKDEYDPLTNGPFQYNPQGKTYDLFSKGIAQTGPIRIRYRRP